MEESETELSRLEADLEDLLEEKRLNMARPMRGVVREALRRQFERAEMRLRARMEALQGTGPVEALAQEPEG